MSASAIASMTGFARAETEIGGTRWVWELRSVNARNLDLRCRLPTGLEGLESTLRQRIPTLCRRGNITVQLSPAQGTQRAFTFRINEDVLKAYLDALTVLGSTAMAPPRLDGMLALPGVVEREEAEAQQIDETALLAAFETALTALAEMRRVEGSRLASIAQAQLADLERLHNEASATAALQPAAAKARIQAQLQPLLEAVPTLSEERLAQEVALIAARADIREELDRLAAHVAATRDLVTSGGPVGRKLDFLCQELNREANTICSKSADLRLTEIGLELKTTIEQLREQVQNIE
ncbi:MAG: YicC/YloC family endoribonuclease [Dongiaceae bacterium]